MAYFVTKYALTRGILEFDSANMTDSGAIIVGPIWVSKNDWFISYDDAKARAEDMKLKKIAALQKQIKALEAKSF